MSWFDSSFSFAKTALSQAQKSIDKVLDIKEDGVHSEINHDQSVGTTAPLATPTPPSTMSPSIAPPSTQTSSHLPVKSTPTHNSTLQSKSSQQIQSNPSQDISQQQQRVKSASHTTPTSGTSSSTWGGANSFWSSPYSSTSPSPQTKGNNTTAKKSSRSGMKLSRSAESASAKSSDVYGSAHGRLTGPTMTSTPVAEDNGGGAKRSVVKEGTPTSRKVDMRSPISPLSLSPTSRGEPQPKSPEAASQDVGVEGTDHDAVELDVIGGEGIAPPTTEVTVETRTIETLESRQDVTSPGGMVSPGGVETVDTGTPCSELGNSGSVVSPKGVTSPEGVASPVGVASPEDMASPGGVTSPEDMASPRGVASALAEESMAVKELPSVPTDDVNSPQAEVVEPVSTSLVTPPSTDASDKDSTTPHEAGPSEVAPHEVAPHEVAPHEAAPHEAAPHRDSVAVTGQESSHEEDSNSGTDSEEVVKLRQEILHSQHVLEVRERKMLEMSRQLADQMETNQTLLSKLDTMKGTTDMDEMREEFTKRIGMSEKKLQAMSKERDSLKKQLTAFQNEQTQQKKSEGEGLSKVLSEKDEKIVQLLEEGEKLSKQELQSNSIIKKLRSKERQNDQLLAAQRQQIDDLEGKVKNLKDQSKKKEETEKKYQESLAQLNAIAEQQAKELSTLKTEKDGLQERVRSLQTNLDNSYKELADLQKANAVNQSAVQHAVASAEQSKQAEVKIMLEQQKVASQKDKECLVMQIEELRMSVSRAEQQLAWKEDHMNQEVANIQSRLQEAEGRNQELTSTISQATKPLLRQIENLQSAHASQSANWEKVETNLTQRLVDAQTQLNVALEKERSAVEQHMTLKSRVGALESQLSSVKQERSQLLATVELEKAKLETLEEGQHRESSKLEALRASYQQSMESLRKEKEMLERQLEYEKVRLEAESRKACLESQEKERLRSQLANSLNHSISRQSSSGSQSEFPERSSLSRENSRRESTSDVSLLGSRPKAGSALAMEHLQSLLKQKEGELANMHSLSSSLERSRSSMAEDLAELSSQNDVLNEQVAKIPFLEQELEAVRQKHEAMLQMYGEKAEEAEELKLDIQDLKSMYRQQIDELVGRTRR